MSDIEKRARKALARFYRARGRNGMAALVLNGHVKASDVELAVVIEYLTPPEGYVLVPECHTPAMDDAGCLALFGSTGGKQSAQVWKCWDAMVAARPEVMP